MTTLQPFTKQAAKASWIIPLVALGMMYIGNSAMKSQPSPLGLLILNGVVILLLIAGIVFGIIGLFGSKQQGVKSTLTPSIIGIILNVSLLSLLLFIAISAFQQKKNAYSQLDNRVNELRNTVLEEINEKGEIGEKSINSLTTMNDDMNKAAEKLSGENKVAVQILLDINKLFLEYGLTYNNKAKSLEDYGVWDFASLKEKGDYEERYELIHETVTACRNCLDFIENIEPYLDTQLEKANISNDTKIQTKTNYFKGFNLNKNRKVYEINCKQDSLMMLLMKLLEENHDKWDVENGQLVSFDEDFLNEYNEMFDTISKLDTEKINIIREEIGSSP